MYMFIPIQIWVHRWVRRIDFFTNLFINLHTHICEKISQLHVSKVRKIVIGRIGKFDLVTLLIYVCIYVHT
jgi:hypothetical protein